MPSLPRPRWSPMRIWSLATAALLTLILAAIIISSAYYTGHSNNNVPLMLLAKGAAVSWVAYIAAYVRDTSIAHQQVILARLHEVEAHLDDYGDRREIAGQMVAAKANGRRLTPIE